MKTKQKQTYTLILCTLALFLISSCGANYDFVHDSNVEEPDEQEIEVSFKIHIAKESIVTRANNSEGLKSLRLLIFDENHQFLYSRDAVISTQDEEVYTYSVKLISSYNNRYIHFIANHDWNSFEPDYFLQGVGEGQIIGSLTTNELNYWNVISVNRLDSSILAENTIELIRNFAKVSVVTSTSDLVLDGFKVYNANTMATVAKFDFDEEGQIHFNPNMGKPIIPANSTITNSEEYNKDAYYLFEKNNNDDHPLFIIIKGTHLGFKNCYYKVDIKRLNPETGVSSLYDVIRNHHYIVSIEKVTDSGYSTEEEAVVNPASNNIFASIELRDFHTISNGTDKLSIEQIGATLVQPNSIFKTKVEYSKGFNKVKFYPSWEDKDEYLGNITINDKDENIEVEVKKIPTDRVLTYFINVVAKPNGIDADYITRQIRIVLRAPYSFNAGYLKNSDSVNISFVVPATLMKSAFPFDVYIESSELTPDMTINNNLLLTLKDGKYLYKYTVVSEDMAGQTIQLPFKQNKINTGSTVTLSSIYFEEQILQIM